MTTQNIGELAIFGVLYRITGAFMSYIGFIGKIGAVSGLNLYTAPVFGGKNVPHWGRKVKYAGGNIPRNQVKPYKN